MPSPLNIILIDDHPLLRMGVAGYIEQEPDLKLTAQMANAAELRAWMAAGNKADAALLDRSLPDADGLDLVSDLRDLGIKVIMLTGHRCELAARDGMEQGAADYVCKPCDFNELLDRVHAVYQGVMKS